MPPASRIISVPSSEGSTIALAMIAAKAQDTVVVAKGSYGGGVMVKADVVLKSAELFGAVLDGGGRGAVVTLGGNATVCGFEIRNGAIGVESKSGGNAVVLCRITGNHESGILCVGNTPRIENNLIAFNDGSGISGWDLISTSASVNHNTIAYNENNGILLGGNSSVILECNIMAYNRNEAVKADQHVRSSMANNDFFKNGLSLEAPPANNF